MKDIIINLKKTIVNFGLIVIALVLLGILLIPGLLIAIPYRLLTPKSLSGYFFDVATSIDMMGGVIFQDMFNFALIKKTDDKKLLFGNPTETISENLGENKLAGNYKDLGEAVDDILDAIDEDHTEDAIKNPKD